MIEKAEKFLNLYVILIVNLLIIAAAELIGNGRYFYDTGLIHLIGAFFAALVIYRIFTRYHLQDQFFKKFMRFSLTAFSVLAVAHILEFLWIRFLPLGQEIIETAVIGFYLTCFFFLAIGLEFILRVARQKSEVNLHLPTIILFLVIIFSIFFMAFGAPLLGEKIKAFLYVYLFWLVMLGIFIIIKSLELKRVLPLMSGFINYLILGIVFIIMAGWLEFFELFKPLFVDEIQITYLAHFTVYFALSFIFLGFGKLLNLGGIYEEVKKEIEKGNL